MASIINSEQPTSSEYNRLKEAEEFENTKLGVKGLIDSGITRIPRIFEHPPETLFDYQQSITFDNDEHNNLIPVIDLSNSQHNELVDQIREAATKFGFFQVVNHGIPGTLLGRLLEAVRAVHEVPAEEKMRHFRRDIINTGTGFGFYSNHDLFRSKAASWRDTISVRLGPAPVDPNDIPDVCRAEVMEWDKEVKQLGEKLVGLLSEGLGLSGHRLKGVSYLGRIAMVGHYYPYCPEPTKTVGLSSHTDLGMLTILLQDQMGGLQVRYDNEWINLKPVDGALVINIGDLFQVINHGIPVSLLDRLLEVVKAVHEMPAEEKMRQYREDILATGSGFGFSSYHDLFESLAASWCDTISVRLSPNPVDPNDIPDVCRNDVLEWDKEVKQLAARLLGLLSEGLGLSADGLKEASYLERRGMVGHYYPYCPEPKKTIGTASHTDLGMFTILLQDMVGGLQVEHDGKWIDLKPVHGALVVNIGDLFQMLSNDKYKSGPHRVYANPWKKPRVSIAVFLSPSFEDENLFGPLDELTSPENPALFKQSKFFAMVEKFMARKSNSKSMVDHFRV